LSAADIGAVTAELASALDGGWIQKIHQPRPRAITLEIRTPGRTQTVLMAAEPGTARLHLTAGRLANPPSPPPFCQWLRARLQGAHVDRIEQLQDDRLVRFRLTTKEGPRSLIAALTGKTADVLVVDSDDRVQISLRDGQRAAGTVWRPPSGGTRPEVERTIPPLTPTAECPYPISAWLDERLGTADRVAAEDRERDARLVQIRKAIKKQARRIEALRGDLEQAERYREYARYGELLKAALPTIQKGQREVSLTDYFDPALPVLTLPLDPAKSPQRNLDDYFKKHRRYLTADREIRPRLADAEADLTRLRNERDALERGETVPAPAVPVRPARRAAVEPKPDKRSGPYRRFTSADGLPIFVGRNARENDELTFAFAHSDDLWLHTQGMPGSHVVVRLEKGADPPIETLRDAATLALLYSDLKKSGKGEVLYTRRKHVRRVKGKSPGTVTVTGEKTIFVTLDRARLTRLKGESG